MGTGQLALAGCEAAGAKESHQARQRSKTGLTACRRCKKVWPEHGAAAAAASCWSLLLASSCLPRPSQLLEAAWASSSGSPSFGCQPHGEAIRVASCSILHLHTWLQGRVGPASSCLRPPSQPYGSPQAQWLRLAPRPMQRQPARISSPPAGLCARFVEPGSDNSAQPVLSLLSAGRLCVRCHLTGLLSWLPIPRALRCCQS